MPAMSEENANRLWTMANFFSILRILFIPLFIDMVIRHKILGALLTFLAASTTDILDGMAARIFRQKTKIGGLLDPAADKLLMTAAIIVLSIPSLSQPNTIPLWLLILIIGRDMAIVTSALVLFKLRAQKSFPPSFWGKASTVCQMGIILCVLLLNFLQVSPPSLLWLYILASFLTFISGLQYGLWGYHVLASPSPLEAEGNDNPVS
jgi:cardiolipin synthase